MNITSETIFEDVQATPGETLFLQTEHPTLQNMKILLSPSFPSFGVSWAFRVILDLDPLTQSNQNPIRI
jgi:hypothetical protein